MNARLIDSESIIFAFLSSKDGLIVLSLLRFFVVLLNQIGLTIFVVLDEKIVPIGWFKRQKELFFMSHATKFVKEPFFKRVQMDTFKK